MTTDLQALQALMSSPVPIPASDVPGILPGGSIHSITPARRGTPITYYYLAEPEQPLTLEERYAELLSCILYGDQTCELETGSRYDEWLGEIVDDALGSGGVSWPLADHAAEWLDQYEQSICDVTASV